MKENVKTTSVLYLSYCTLPTVYRNNSQNSKLFILANRKIIYIPTNRLLLTQKAFINNLIGTIKLQLCDKFVSLQILKSIGVCLNE